MDILYHDILYVYLVILYYDDMFPPVMFPLVIFCAITGVAIIAALSAAIIATIIKICFEFIVLVYSIACLTNYLEYFSESSSDNALKAIISLLNENMEKDGKTHDLYGENDIPKSKFLNIELYMDKHAKELVDFIEKEIKDNSQKVISLTGEIPDRIINELSKEMPLSPTFEMTHNMLTDALETSLWCGWLSQSKVNKKESK